MMFREQIGLEWLAAELAGRRGHVHHFTGGLDREHTPERNILRQRAKRDFPFVRFDDIHDDGRNQHDKECDRPELRGHVVDASKADMPYDENDGQEADKEKEELKHG